MLYSLLCKKIIITKIIDKVSHINISNIYILNNMLSCLDRICLSDIPQFILLKKQQNKSIY